MVKFIIRYNNENAIENGYSEERLIDYTTKYFETKSTVRKVSDYEWEDDSSDAIGVFFLFMKKILADNHISSTIEEMRWIVDGKEENCLEIENKRKKKADKVVRAAS